MTIDLCQSDSTGKQFAGRGEIGSDALGADVTMSVSEGPYFDGPIPRRPDPNRHASICRFPPGAGPRALVQSDQRPANASQTPNECLICRSIDIAPSVYLPWQQY